MIFKLDNLGNFNLDYCSSQGFNFNFKTAQENTINDDVNDTKRKNQCGHLINLLIIAVVVVKNVAVVEDQEVQEVQEEEEVPIVVDEEMESDPHDSIES